MSAAYVDEEISADFRVDGGEVSHGDADVEGWGEDAAAEFGDGFTVFVEDGVVGARWWAFADEFDGGEFEFRAVSFLGEEGFASGEGGFFEVAEEAEAGLDGGVFG